MPPLIILPNVLLTTARPMARSTASPIHIAPSRAPMDVAAAVETAVVTAAVVSAVVVDTWPSSQRRSPPGTVAHLRDRIVTLHATR